MSKKLFVGRLPFDFTNERLEALFAGTGTVVSARMTLDPKQGRTRGFGFVEMQSESEAMAAIEKLNGFTVGDRPIWVTIARPKTSESPRTDWKPREGFRGPRPFGNSRFRPSEPGGRSDWPTGPRADWKPREGSSGPRPFGNNRFRSSGPGGSSDRPRGPRPDWKPREGSSGPRPFGNNRFRSSGPGGPSDRPRGPRSDWKPREGSSGPRPFGHSRFRPSEPGAPRRFGGSSRPNRGPRPSSPRSREPS